MDKNELLTLITNLVQESAGFESDQVALDQKSAIDAYNQRDQGDEDLVNSKVVSGDISAVVEANTASMMESFSSDHIVGFEPNDKEDEDQAQLESDVVTHFVMDANPGFLNFLQGIKDALMLRNGMMKVWVQDKVRVETKSYENVTPIAYAGFLAREEVETEVIEYNEKAETLKVRETRPNRELKIESTPPENFIYTKNWTSLDLQDVPICGERHVDIRSDLIDRGFDEKEVNNLPVWNGTNQAGAARNPQGEQTNPTKNSDSSLDRIEWYEVYVLVDADGDGIAERHRISLVLDKVILEDEEVQIVSHAAGSALITPHRFLGISMYDKLKMVQEITTGYFRMMLDNANVSNKSRTAYLDGKVDVDDLDNGLVDGNIRVTGKNITDVRQAIMPFNQPDISAGMLAGIQYMNKIRSELGGAALDLATAQAQLGDAVGSQGVDRAYSVMEQLNALMTKTIAESLIRHTYLLVHATLRQHFDKQVDIKKSGKWISAIPSQWKKRTRLNVKIGMSPGERARRVNSLGFILKSQMEISAQGGTDILVNRAGFYATLMDWARASDVPNPEQYFIDPSSEESKVAVQQKEQAAQAETEAQKKLSELVLGLKQLEISLTKYDGDEDRKVDAWKKQQDINLGEAKLIADATLSELKAIRETLKDDKPKKEEPDEIKPKS